MKLAKEVACILSGQSEEVAKYLLPRGKKVGNEWCAGNALGDEGKSLKVRLNGSKAGVWCDFAEGSGGDLLDLWALAKKISISDALKEACQYLGLKRQKFVGHEKKLFSKPVKKLTTVHNKHIINYLVTERRLSQETLKQFQIGEENGCIVFPFIRDNQIIFIKYLKLEREGGKKSIFSEKGCEPCLFGWHMIPKNARSITICEGEIDAMSLHQYGRAALSVPFGAGEGKKHEWIEYEFERLAVFDEIFLCFDNDEPGEKAAEYISKRLGQHRCKIVKLPAKDANECLQENLPPVFLNNYFQEAVTLDPEELKSARDYLDKVLASFYPSDGKEPGYEAPWDKCRDKILFRPYELSVWTGTNGHGKSQFLGQVMLGMMKEGAKICVASLELRPEKSLFRMTHQATGMTTPSPDYITHVHEWYKDKLWIFDLVGNAKSDRLLEVFLYAHRRYGIDVFVIDSFMKLDIAEDDYKAQKIFIEKLCDFKNQYQCQIHIVVHPRKGSDEKEAPGKMDVKGTGAITDLADSVYTVWRDKTKERIIEKLKTGGILTEAELEISKRSDCLLKCDKQRNGDWEGCIGFWFDKGSYQYLSGENQKPAKIVNYACPIN